ncbi:MAG: hypothetical protein J5I47_04620 [Vicingus serpentipes]|nr:hypothetical protein [Vicingus serpentipes]
MSATIEHNEELRLRRLIDSIKKNDAEIKDYKEFENLLNKYGVSDDEIMASIKNAGFNSWDDYYTARKKAKDKEEKRITNVVIVGAIVALALAVIFGLIDGKGNKKP